MKSNFNMSELILLFFITFFMIVSFLFIIPEILSLIKRVRDYLTYKNDLY